jgi:hypothetical protein
LPLHESVEVPDAPSVTIVGLNVQVNPVEGVIDDESETVPVNEFIAVTVTVVVPAAPALALTLVGLAVTEKSGTATL